MKLITRDSDYAVRALCFIAKNQERVVSVAELVSESKVPRPFLRKILQLMTKRGLLLSFRGMGGGFKLKIKPGDIFITDVMEIFQGKLNLNECFLKKLACPHKRTCPLRQKVKKIESRALKSLHSITIAALLRG